jgi:hypothetical protein
MGYCISFVFDPRVAKNQEEIVDKFCNEGFEVLPSLSEYMSRIKDLRHPKYDFEISVFPDKSANSWIYSKTMPDDMENMLREMLCLSEKVGCSLYIGDLKIVMETIKIARQQYVTYWAKMIYFNTPYSPEEIKALCAAEAEALGVENISYAAYSQEAALNLNIYNFRMSALTISCLREANITYVGELVQKKPEDLKKIRSMSRESIEEICEVLRGLGLTLNMKLSNWPPRRMIQ